MPALNLLLLEQRDNPAGPVAVDLTAPVDREPTGPVVQVVITETPKGTVAVETVFVGPQETTSKVEIQIPTFWW